VAARRHEKAVTWSQAALDQTTPGHLPVTSLLRGGHCGGVIWSTHRTAAVSRAYRAGREDRRIYTACIHVSRSVDHSFINTAVAETPTHTLKHSRVVCSISTEAPAATATAANISSDNTRRKTSALRRNATALDQHAASTTQTGVFDTSSVRFCHASMYFSSSVQSRYCVETMAHILNPQTFPSSGRVFHITYIVTKFSWESTLNTGWLSKICNFRPTRYILEMVEGGSYSSSSYLYPG